MQKPIYTFLALVSYSWYTNLTASFIPQVMQDALSSSSVTLQQSNTNATISEDSSDFEPLIFVPIIVGGCAILTLLSLIIKKYCCTPQCQKACRPRCGKCRRKSQARVFPEHRVASTISTAPSSSSTSSLTSNTIHVTPRTPQQRESIYISEPLAQQLRANSIEIPRLPLAQLQAAQEQPEVIFDLTTIKEAPTSQTCQTCNTRPISFRASLTQPQSQKTSPDQAKIDAARCEAAILNDPNLAPEDRLTRASVTARCTEHYQVEPQESPV